jgi:hypothetical protein
VTTRTMPQPTRTYRWLAQVTPLSDGLPDPSSSWTAQRSLSSACSPQVRFKPAPTRRSPRALGQRLTSVNRLPTGSAIDAKNGCSRGKQQETLHASGVVSRVPCRSRHAQRSGRTETLTGKAAHTSRSAELERAGMTSNRRRTEEEKCLAHDDAG